MGRIGAAEEDFYCGTGSAYAEFQDPYGKPAIGQARGVGITRQVLVEEW